jgi:peptidase E
VNLALTSNFPSTVIPAVLDIMRGTSPQARIAWIPPFTAIGRERFLAAQALFASYGFVDVSYCDIDEDPVGALLDHLADFDVVYLTGGDPIGFRRNILRAELPARLRACLAAGRLVVGASGGAMQLTKNISLFRLMTVPLDEVLATHREYEALGFVNYEILPHANRLEPSLLETVRLYSEHVTHDVLALADGAAVLHTGSSEYRCVGQASRFRRGIVTSIGSAA